MKLSERYRPRTLRDVIGQPPVRFLQALANDPYDKCVLLEGPPGCGKTAAAYALAHDLGTHPDDFHVVIGSEFSVDVARELWRGPLRYMPRNPGTQRVVLLEELEFLSGQTQTFLKTALETQLPKGTIVIATTNGATKLSKALLQRFQTYHFSGGPTFATAAVERLQAIWAIEAPGQPVPHSLPDWGWDGDEFSMRKALEEMSDHVALFAEVAA
jgi:replication-associated recombination protein RarA